MDVQMPDAAQRTFEIENNIESLDAARDAIYQFDEAANKEILKAKPWATDPQYFKRVNISAIALLKMAIHARSGGAIEVMGMMTGKVIGDSFVVMDAYPLPVEGTETRVNPQAEAYEYMVGYISTLHSLGRKENIVGWYHSHPGYGCWLSGIDVGTQSQNQQYQDPFLAVVIDPNRTISAGKVEIGAFRTYPENYKPPGAQESEYQTIPLAKMEDFGAHASQYYPLEISHFKSSLDTRLLELLWNKYWVSTLSQSPLLTNREYASQQMLDLSRKIPKAEAAVNAAASSAMQARSSMSRKEESGESELDKVLRDTTKIASEEIHGLLSQAVKDRIFNNLKTSSD
ncbi:JAB1/Mov34/MPN/PAD-1 ubiquitin protease-domain-containing protein [Kockiozyma suomiensis]|uniref:JAB1/Mov34/MPN/PAD-1 ubiquitin protease-domain-containing protein n=1 Tax=Kockiozyma suomiensis TaxID=1337062 RepID=UPI0033435B64